MWGHRASKIPRRIPQAFELPKPQVFVLKAMMNSVPRISEDQDPIGYKPEYSVSEARDQFLDAAFIGSSLSSGFSAPKAPRLRSPDRENVELLTPNGDTQRLLYKCLFILCVAVILHLLYNQYFPNVSFIRNKPKVKKIS